MIGCIGGTVRLRTSPHLVRSLVHHTQSVNMLRGLHIRSLQLQPLSKPTQPAFNIGLRHFAFSRSNHREKPAVSSNYKAPVVPKSGGGNSSPLPVFPLIIIFGLGSLSFHFLLKSREGQGQSHYKLPAKIPPRDPRPHNKQDSQ